MPIKFDFKNCLEVKELIKEVLYVLLYINFVVQTYNSNVIHLDLLDIKNKTLNCFGDFVFIRYKMQRSPLNWSWSTFDSYIQLLNKTDLLQSDLYACISFTSYSKLNTNV